MESIHELRRKAPLHYWRRADNARFTAFLLHEAVPKEVLDRAAEGGLYGGSTEIATTQAFLREMAFALESIVKAVIAGKFQKLSASPNMKKVRPTHDIEKLWTDAGLPPLDELDLARMMIASEILFWSGKYAAPNDGAEARARASNQRISTLRPRERLGSLDILTPFNLTWADMNRLYKIAENELWSLGDF